MKRSTIAKNFTITTLTALALGMGPAANADDKGCSNAILKGTFSHQGTGAVTSPPDFAGPEAIVGTEFFDGYGVVTGIGTGSLNGTTFAYTDEQGTYNVNPDCTGTYTVEIPSQGLTGTNAIHIFFVIISTVNALKFDAATELQFVETDAGSVFSGVAKRQFPIGDSRN
jgi:hypothetical protein